MHPPPPSRSGVDAVLHALLKQSFGLFPDDLGSVTAALIREHTTAEDPQLLLVDLDQSVLTALDGSRTESVEWSAAGEAFREQQPVWERTVQGRRLWCPVLDSAERVAVLGVLGGEEVPVDDWLTLASLLGELIVAKSRYGDHLTNVRRREPASIAAEMRWNLLPPLTFSSPEVAVSGILQPSYGVAGDAFDYSLRNGHASVAVFDAMGHGLPASRVANLAVGALRAGRRSGLTGGELLLSVDEVLVDQFDGAVFVTAQILDLDLDAGVAHVFTAGHPPPVRLRAREEPSVISVRPGLPLGLGPSTYQPSVVRLEPGDALLMVSDGIYEARSADDVQYGWDRMIAAVQDRLDAGDRSPEILRRAIRGVLDFQAVPRDDMTMAIVRWRPEVVGLHEPPSAEQLHEAETADRPRR